MTLLSIGNDAKTVKGERFGYVTGIHYGAPATLAGGKTVCAFATSDCIALCLNTAGLGGVYKSIQEARIARTRLWQGKPDVFLDQLEVEIAALEKRAKREGKTAVVRLNGTSDVLWETTGIMSRFPHLQFYDYTKYPIALRRNLPGNYHLTYSFSGLPISEKFARQWLAAGVNVAVVFHGGLPREFFGCPVLDGDKSDLRFLDSPGHIVGLKAKGKAIKADSPFVVQVEHGEVVPMQRVLALPGDGFPFAVSA